MSAGFTLIEILIIIALIGILSSIVNWGGSIYENTGWSAKEFL
ncbi:MAG TPA: prepilin-type N-terminal cleavage/methylation domain-containing protein [Ignavibacteria bacterium]|nr:prepilin-type N-terminal cleavage/methylation domain-containing protein [Ignavibacteria bacterium]